MITLSAQAEPLTFGTGADDTTPLSLNILMQKPDEYLGQKLTIEGVITKVCKKRGCWMELATEQSFDRLVIKVRDGDMVFPMSKLGHKALATGQLQAIDLDPEQTREYMSHQAKEVGQPVESEAMSEGIRIYRFSPTGVTILD
ncbi:DUF4920 domain-containing protein [Bowmanella denitrificans]|uniref:DUF4920 domain-containing protein n=1 Tax=Bowmanella denitrificans TaxID=366582 RepID=UPI0031DA032F